MLSCLSGIWTQVSAGHCSPKHTSISGRDDTVAREADCCDFADERGVVWLEWDTLPEWLTRVLAESITERSTEQAAALLGTEEETVALVGWWTGEIGVSGTGDSDQPSPQDMSVPAGSGLGTTITCDTPLPLAFAEEGGGGKGSCASMSAPEVSSATSSCRTLSSLSLSCGCICVH